MVVSHLREYTSVKGGAMLVAVCCHKWGQYAIQLNKCGTTWFLVPKIGVVKIVAMKCMLGDILHPLSSHEVSSVTQQRDTLQQDGTDNASRFSRQETPNNVGGGE